MLLEAMRPEVTRHKEEVAGGGFCYGLLSFFFHQRVAEERIS